MSLAYALTFFCDALLYYGALGCFGLLRFCRAGIYRVPLVLLAACWLSGRLTGRGKPIFVDTNISVETLKSVAAPRHVLVMLADPEIGIHRFFDRPDPEKQFLYKLMLEEPDPQAALDNYREILTRICSKESYDKLLHSGFEAVFRDEARSQEETVLLAEKIFGLS